MDPYPYPWGPLPTYPRVSRTHRPSLPICVPRRLVVIAATAVVVVCNDDGPRQDCAVHDTKRNTGRACPRGVRGRLGRNASSEGNASKTQIE